MIASFPIARPELQSAAYQDAAVGCELAIGIIEQVRSIRASERRIYQQITDIFAERVRVGGVI